MAETTVTQGVPAIPGSAARSDAAGAVDRRDREAERAKLKQLAQEFEALLMNEMLSGWRRSLMDDDESEGGGLSNMTEMASGEFGRALSRSGGLGIAAMLEDAFERQQGARADPAATGVSPHANGVSAIGTATAPHADAAVSTVRKSVAPRAEMGMQPIVDVTRDAMRTFSARADRVGGIVTSPYGWRADPLSGQATFHAGVDVRMAYGQTVSSVATGRVSFSGTQGGYGLTVVIDHGDGMQTRYAHLSSVDVQVGDEVRRGQGIARSGSSGKSTAPHLHVEVLRHGRPVDPTGLLKPSGPGVDWEAYRSPSIRGQGPSSDPV